VDHLSETYAPRTLTRGAIEQANEIHRTGLEITLPRDDPLGTLFLAAPPEGIVSVTLYRGTGPTPSSSPTGKAVSVRRASRERRYS
jgi:hypothetical protein